MIRRQTRSNETRFAIVKATNPAFPLLVEKREEALQILHHAYVLNIRYICLLIGDENCNIIAGIWVEFDNDLKEAWGKVLKDLHDNSVGMFYNNNGVPFQPTTDQKKLLKPVLKQIKVNKAPLDLYSFIQNLHIWQDLRLWSTHPLPQIANVLPMIFSEWNAGKGGSDSRSKDIWNA